MADGFLGDANNDSIATYLQQCYYEISDGLYKILYSLNFIQGSSRYLSQLSYIIQTVQMIGILFTVNGSVAIIPWSQIHARPVISFCSFFSEQGLNSFGASQASFQIALVLVGILIGGGVAIAWLTKHNNQIPVLLELYSVLANLMVSILFVPITRVLIQQIVGGSALYQFLGVITVLPMTALSVCCISVVFDANPLSKSASARSQTRIDVLYAISKILLVIVSVCATNAFFLSTTAFILSTGVSYSLTMYLPYYDYRMMQFQAALSWIFSWASLSAIVASVYNNDSSGGAVFMFIGGIPVVALSSYLIIQGRFEHLRAAPVLELKNPWEVQTRFRIALQDVDQTAMKTALLKQHKLRAKLESMHDDKEEVVIELAGGEKSEIGGHYDHLANYNECKSIIITSLTRFPDSIHLLLAAASFHVDIARIYFLAYMYLDQVAALNPKADERFLLYRIQRTIEDRIFESESNSEVIQYNTQRDLLERAQNLDLRIVQATIDFWTEALKSKPDDDRMRELAVQISNESKTAYSSYSKAIGISDDSVAALQSYSGFLLTILRDPRSGERLLERAKEMQQAKAKLKQTSVFKDLLFDDRAAVVLISGNMRSLGVIIDCNLRASQLLGFSKSILIGKNSRIFLPEPFASNHDGLLLRNLQQGVQRLVDGKNNLAILHQSGYVQDVNLFVKAFIKDLSTLCFIGVIESINPDSLVIIYDRAGVVTAISQTVSLQLGIEKERVDSHDIHIEDIIPDIEAQHAAYRKAIVSNPDYIRTMSLEKDGTQFQMSIRFQSWDLLNDDLAVTVRIDILGKRFVDGPDPTFHKPAMILEDIPISLSATAESSDSERSSQSDGSQDNSQSSESESEPDHLPAVSELAVDHMGSLDPSDRSAVVHREEPIGEDPGHENHPPENDNVEQKDINAQTALAGADIRATADHVETDAHQQDIQPFYPNMTTKDQKKSSSKAQGSRGKSSAQSHSKSRSKKDHSPDGSRSLASNATSNATSQAADNEMNNDALQKRLEQTLMKWLHRAFISVFLMLAVLSLGQVFVAQQIVADFMAAIGTSNFSGEYAMDYLRVADSVRVVDLISKGHISDPDHSLVRQHFDTIRKFAGIANTCRDSLLAGRLGWDAAVMNEYSSTFPFTFCTQTVTSGCNFQITTLVAFDMFNQLSREVASVPVDRLDLIDPNSVRFVIENVGGLSEISNVVSGFGASAAKEQNRLIRLADLADLVLQIAAAAFLFLYAVRATIIGVQLRNDHALITVFHVQNSSINQIIAPYSDRLSILQKTESIDSENQDARTEASFNIFNSLTKEKNSDSSKQKRLKRIESQIRKTSKFKTRRLLRYFLKFGQLIVLYTFFFTYRHVGILNQADARAPLPVRFQYGWRSAALIRRALFNTRELLLVSADLLLSRNAVNDTAALHASIEADLVASEVLRRTLAFGGELNGDYYPGSLTAGNGHFELEFSDVCSIPDVAAAAKNCESFSNGIARNGRQALVSELARLIPVIITDMDSSITNIISDPNFVHGVQARDDFLKAKLQSSEVLLAFEIDNNYNGNTMRYFSHLLTLDRARLAVDRLNLGYILIAMVIMINIYGYFGVVMSALRDIAREFTQTQDLLKFVPVEIRELISKDTHKKSKKENRSNRAISLITKGPFAVLRLLRRSPLLPTALLLGISAICLAIFIDPSSIWKSLSSDPIIAVGTVCDVIIASWTPFGFGTILSNLDFGSAAKNAKVQQASHFGQVCALCMTSLMNGALGQSIDWNMVLFGTLGSILGNVFSFFLVDGVFDRDLVQLASVAFFITYSLTMGIAQRYLSAKTFKKIQNITGMDHIDVLVFGALSGAFSYLNGSSSGALLFFMVDCYFQLHFSVALPTSILVGALNSVFLLGFHELLGLQYVNLSDVQYLNIILSIIFILTPVFCYFSAKSQGRYFKEYMVIISIAFGVFLSATSNEVGTWIFIYVFICGLVLWLPVCASTAVGGTIRSAAFEDV